MGNSHTAEVKTLNPQPALPQQTSEVTDHARDPLDRAAALLIGGARSGGAPPRVNRAIAQRSLVQLQRQRGNQYVQRVIGLAAKAEGAPDVTPDVESAIHRARGGGQALDGKVRKQMESSIGADFSGVHVHTGSESDRLNREVNAVAFTTGQDVFFRQGAYDPSSTGGRELIAHELTHVVQQGGGSVKAKMTVSEPGDPFEREADAMARKVIQREESGDDDKKLHTFPEPGAGLMRARDEDQEKLHRKAGPDAGDLLGVADLGEGTLQRSCACGSTSGSAGACPSCREKEQVNRRGADSSTPVIQRGLLGDIAEAVIPDWLLNKIKGAGETVKTIVGALSGDGQSIASAGQSDGDQVAGKAQADAGATAASGEQAGQQTAAKGQQEAQSTQQQAQTEAAKGDSAASWVGALGKTVGAAVNVALPVLPAPPVGGGKADPGIPGLGSVPTEAVDGAKKAIDDSGGWNCDESEVVAIASSVKKAVVDAGVKAGQKLLGADRFNALMGFVSKMKGKLQKAAEAVKAKVASIEKSVREWWDKKVGPYIKKLQEFGKTLSEAFDKLKKKVSDGVNAVIKWGAEKWDWLKKNVVDKIAEKVAAVKARVEGLIQSAREAVGSWWNKLPGWLKDIIEGAAALVTGPAGIAIAAGVKAAQYIAEHKDSILAKLKHMADAVLQKLASFYNTVKEYAGKALDKIKELGTKVFAKIKSALQAAYKWVDDATGGQLSKLVEAAQQFGDKIKGKVCTALGETAGPCVEQFVPSPGELAKKGTENFVELKTNADVTVPVYDVPVKVARGSSIRISTKGEKKYDVEIVGSGSVAVKTPGEAENSLDVNLPAGMTPGSAAWKKLSGEDAPKKKDPAPASKPDPKSADKKGPEVDAEAGLSCTVTMAYEFDASKKPDTTCGGLGGLTALLASQGLAATLPMPFGALAGAAGEAIVGPPKSCKVKVAEYGSAEVSIGMGGAGELKAKLEAERAIEVEATKEGDLSATISQSLGAGGDVNLAGGLVNLGGLDAKGELSLKLTYSTKLDTIKALEAAATFEASMTIEKAERVKTAIPKSASAVHSKVDPLVTAGQSGTLTVEGGAKVTQLQELVSQLDGYFAKPDQVSVDGALGIAKEFLKSHSTADLTVTLTTGQTYGIKGSAGEKDVQVGGEVSVTKGTKQVIYSSEGGGEE